MFFIVGKGLRTFVSTPFFLKEIRMKKIIVILSLLVFCLYGCKSQQKVVSNKTTTTEAKVVQNEQKEQETNVIDKSTIDTKQDEVVIVIDDSLSLSNVIEIKKGNQVPDFWQKVKVKEIRINTSTQSKNNNVVEQTTTTDNNYVKRDENTKSKEQTTDKQKNNSGWETLSIIVLLLVFSSIVLFLSREK